MSYPIVTKEPSIKHPHHNKELDDFVRISAPPAKRKKINHQEEALGDKEGGLSAAKGIIYALLFCVPFWILVTMLFVWLI